MSIAFLFPGQGSQSPGMLHRLPDHPTVASTLAEVGDALQMDNRALDTEEALHSTVSVQLALFAAGVATARALMKAPVAIFLPQSSLATLVSSPLPSRFQVPSMRTTIRFMRSSRADKSTITRWAAVP